MRRKLAAVCIAITVLGVFVSSSAVAKQSSSDLTCMTEMLYHEARGETVLGQLGVAQVVFNRIKSKDFPPSVCGVIRQTRGKICQFSFYCERLPVREKDEYVKVKMLAMMILANNGATHDPTNGATYYINPHVMNKADVRRFAKGKIRVAVIGCHWFYKDRVAKDA